MGFIYSQKRENLTISKDILYDKEEPPQAKPYQTDRHHALKELLKSRGTLKAQEGRYEEGKASLRQSVQTRGRKKYVHIGEEAKSRSVYQPDRSSVRGSVPNSTMY